MKYISSVFKPPSANEKFKFSRFGVHACIFKTVIIPFMHIKLVQVLYSVVHIWWGNCKPLCFHKKMNISPTQSKKWGSKQKSQMFLTINIVFMGRRFLISITFTCPCTLQAQLQYVKLNTQMPFYLRWPFS